MSSSRKRYAQVGLGGRSDMYTGAILGPYKDVAEIVALCDRNQGRMDLANRQIEAVAGKAAPTYAAEQFDQMVANPSSTGRLSRHPAPISGSQPSSRPALHRWASCQAGRSQCRGWMGRD